MARQPRGLAGAGGAARGVRLRRHRDVRRRRAAAASHCPVGIDTGKLVKALRARRHSASGRTRRRARPARRWGIGRTRGRAPALRAGRTLGDGPTRGAHRDRAHAPSRTSSCRPGASRCPTRRRRRRGRAREGAAAVYFPACVNRIFGNPRGQPARPVAAGGAADASPPARDGRCGSPTDVGGPLLRHAVELEGLRGRATPQMARATADGDPRLDRGRAPAARRRRHLLHARAARGGPRARSTSRGARNSAEVRILDSISWVHDDAARRAAAGGEARQRARCTRRARRATSGLPEQLDGGRRRARRRVSSPRRAELLRHRRRPRPAAPRAARGLRALASGSNAAMQPAAALPVQQPHLRDRAHRRRPATRYGSFVLLLEELTRPGSRPRAIGSPPKRQTPAGGEEGVQMSEQQPARGPGRASLRDGRREHDPPGAHRARSR